MIRIVAVFTRGRYNISVNSGWIKVATRKGGTYGSRTPERTKRLLPDDS